MKQTVVEWIFNELWNCPKDKFNWYAILDQAKEMEKEQLFEFWQGGINCTEEKGKSFEQYYTMENKQTAVEWLIEQWPILQSQLPDWLIEQAKQMEKDQIINAYNNGDLRSAELYYNETYGFTNSKRNT